MDELFAMLMGDDDDIDMQLHQKNQRRKSRRSGRGRRKRKYSSPNRNGSSERALIRVQSGKDQPKALIRVHSQSKRQKTSKTRRMPFFRRRKQKQQKEEEYWEEEESWDDEDDDDDEEEYQYVEDIDDVEESQTEKENYEYEDIEDEDEQGKENKQPVPTYQKPKFTYQAPNLEPEISTPSFSAASSMAHHLIMRKDPSYKLNRTSTIKSIGSRSELHCQRTVTAPGLTKSLSQGSATMQKGLASDHSSTRSLSSIQSSKKRTNVRNKAPTSFQTYRNGQLIVASFRKQK